MNLAYVAGLIDADGCIGFTRIRRRIYPRVFITNTNIEILEDVQAAFGGNISIAKRHDPKWKRAGHWRISNGPAVDFLDRIYPWLRIKANQALLAFAWSAIAPGRGGTWSEDGLKACVLLDQQRKWLNWKGSGDRGPEPMVLALNA